MKIQKSIDIGVPAEKIWPFLIQPDKLPRWYFPMQKLEYTGQQRSGVGTPIYFEEKAAGRVMKLNFVVTQWVENQRLALKMTSGNFLKGYEQWWTIEPIPSGSRFIYAEDIKLPYGVIGKFLGVFARRGSLATAGEMLAKLKSLAEA